MAALLYSLRHVPDEEAEAIRALLREHHIAFYETAAGGWGVSAAAIWLKHESDLTHAKALLQTFHHAWGAAQREKFAQARRDGTHAGFLDGLKRHPLRVIAYLAIALGILYFSTKPFVSLGN